MEKSAAKKMFLALGVALLAALSVHAQVDPKAEISASFSVLQPDTRGTYLMPGWQSNFSLNLRKRFAIATDIGAQYRGGNRRVEALVGPQFTVRGKSATGFAHVLIGGLRQSRFGKVNSFAAAFGGGVDLNVGKRLAVRMFQFDYIPNTAGSGSAVRLGLFGIVIKLGQREPGRR